ncbi:xanthine/uracil permease [Clavulina sp. PMI_390]|nr:xanthine/uracil permease [Clavulina sp. PMI_390]
MSDPIDAQPEPSTAPQLGKPPLGARIRDIAARRYEKITTKDGWVGEYDFGWLCMPGLPWGGPKRRSKAPPFYALEADLPILLAMVVGFQHALAMLAGLITPPIIFASTLALDPATQSYMVSASLIGCGILSLVQMSRIPLFGGYRLGTGLLTVVGTSFATLSTAFSIFNSLYANGTCPTITVNGVSTNGPCPDAYGMLLGTSLVCSFLEMGLSFVPVRILKRIFPPIVTGTVILLIGASLIGSSGITNWGGGSNCLDGLTATPPVLCGGLRPTTWGSPEYIGLGFLSFITIVLVEFFGSPFMKNASIIIGLIVGCIVAGGAGYIDGSSIRTAPAITFLWVKTFKLDVYGPAILPMLAVYISLAMEAIGDITASAEVSRVEVEGEDFDSRIQGGVLSDGIGGFVSALFTVTPLSIFAQNNGVIAITRCANRGAGRWCCFFLILFGILGKISGVFLAIPDPVLGGVTTFLFASVAVSGLRVLSYVKWQRRDRFILAAALSPGLGDLLVPGIFEHLFDQARIGKSNALQGFFDSITIVLDTPFLAAGITAVILNLLLPLEVDDREDIVETGTPETTVPEHTHDVEAGTDDGLGSKEKATKLDDEN